LLFGLRLTAAVLLALFLAFYLELETPYWAGTSACIVCQPILGSSVLKGAFRMIGTVVGCVAAVILMAIFPQDRTDFLFAMLLWISVCSFVSTLLRNFSAYAAMLAGYTLVIIAATSIAAPDRLFEIAVGRASEIGIGIFCGTLVLALTDLGKSPQRLAGLVSQLIVETADHLCDVLARAGAGLSASTATRRKLIERTAALEPVVDQAAGESPELLQRRPVLYAAMNGLFGALSGARTVETHLHSLPEAAARRSARIVLSSLPPDWAAEQGPRPLRHSALDRGINVSVVRNLLRLKKTDFEAALTADGAAEVAAGLAIAANGLTLVNDPGQARDLSQPAGLFVADYLPALANAFRTFIGVGAAVLFWIVTAWPNGLQAVTFAAITIMVFSPMHEKSRGAALDHGAGTLLAAITIVIVKFALLPNHETFWAFALIIAIVLVPFGALSAIPRLAPYFVPATLSFVPLLEPTNQIAYDASTYFNGALGLLTGSFIGNVALALIPPVSPRARSQRLVDLSIRDLKRLAASRRKWTLSQWQSRIYARLTAMPEDAEPIQRSYLVATLSVGIQLIRLQRLSRNGRAGAELSTIEKNLASGDLPKLRSVLDSLDKEISAIPDSQPGVSGRLRARLALRAIREAVDRQDEYFIGGRS
jgi:uncharacterized membrane protein YccC